MNNKPLAWEGAEEWEHLAWELCADEHGEESCTDLIWTMDVIPEPWGDRWQKYEDEAKRMIAMVRKFTHPVKELTDEEKLIFGMLFMNWNRSLKEPLIKPAYEQYVFEQAIAILRKAQET